METLPLKELMDFGFPAFLVIAILWGIWKLGNRYMSVTEKTMERQAQSGEKTAEAVNTIAELSAATFAKAEVTGEKLSGLGDCQSEVCEEVRTQGRAFIKTIDALKEMTPDERAHRLLNEAHEIMEKK